MTASNIPFLSPNSLKHYYRPTFGELWNPAYVTNELDDVSSVASTPSLSPTSDLDTFPGELVEDEDDVNFPVSPGVESTGICQSLDHIYSSPFQPYPFFDYDSSTPAPCSPSRRRSATLPELEPSTFNADLFGLHKSIPSEEPALSDIDLDIPDIRWRSFPGCETDDDLIPMELTLKNYIPDPFQTVPTTSTETGSLLLWNHDYNDRCDIPIPRSPSPELFYLDPTILAECGDEELQNVYELRQRTAKNEKWDRERCRELSALLRLKLDERGVLYSGEGVDCSHQKRGSRSLSRQAQSEGPKHKIKSVAQLVAAMLFHRQSDALRRHPSRKASFERTSSHSSHYSPYPSEMGAMKGHLTPTRSRLSKVILPEELDMSLSHAFRIDQ